MTVHRVRLVHSVTGADSYHGWLDQWLTNMQAWDAPEVTNDVPTLREPIDGSDSYYQGELAFAWSEDKAIILDNIHQYAQSYCDWHRIAYHVCTHDETDPQPCSWDDVRENGVVPSHVPTFEVSA
jgi:hypothetical protein